MAKDEPGFWEAVIPYLPTIGLVLCAILGGSYAVWNRRRGAEENRMPSVAEMWGETERARSMWRYFEDLFYEARGAFRGYVRRVQAGGSTELTHQEKAAHDRKVSPPEQSDETKP